MLLVRLRVAARKDEAFVLKVRNTKFARRASFQGGLIRTARHREWFRRVLRDRTARLYVIEAAKKPVGTVRLDRLKRMSEVHLALLPAWKGKGIGTRAVQMLLERSARRGGPRVVLAHIKKDNAASMGLFKKLGFRKFKGCLHGGHPKVRCVSLRRRVSA